MSRAAPMNVKKSAHYALLQTKNAAQSTHVGDLKGVDEVLKMAETDIGVANSVNLFEITKESGPPFVVMCDSLTLQPLQNVKMSNVLETVHHTGGVPPSAVAHGHVWRVMGLAELRRMIGSSQAIQYALYPFHRSTEGGGKAHTAMAMLHNWAFWRTLYPSTDPNHTTSKRFVPSTEKQRVVSSKLMLEGYLTVLHDAIAMRNQRLIRIMTVTINNFLVDTEDNRKFLGQRIDPNSGRLEELANQLAKTLERRRIAGDYVASQHISDAERARMAREVTAVRDNSTLHPLDYYALVRLVMMGAADVVQPNGRSTSSTHLFARAVYDWSAHNPILALTFDKSIVGCKNAHEMSTPFYVLRMLTDTLCHANSHNIKETTEAKIVKELVKHAESEKVMRTLRRVFIVVQCSRLHSLCCMDSYNDICKAAWSFPNLEELIMALVPEVLSMPNAHKTVRNAVAEIMFQNNTASKGDSKYSVLDGQWLFTAGASAHQLRGIRAHLEQRDTRHKSMNNEASLKLEMRSIQQHLRQWAPASNDDIQAARFLGCPELVRTCFMRVAYELMVGNYAFVLRCFREPSPFQPRTLKRLLAPLTQDEAEASAIGLNFHGPFATRRGERVRTYTSSSRRRCHTMRIVQDYFKDYERGKVDSVLASMPAPFEVYDTFKDGASAAPAAPAAPAASVEAAAPNTDGAEATSWHAPPDAPPAAPPVAPECKANEWVQTKLHALDASIQNTNSTLAPCPICFDEKPVDKVHHVHPDSGHPDDCKICEHCARLMPKCPFCRVKSTWFDPRMADLHLTRQYNDDYSDNYSDYDSDGYHY